MMKKEILDNIWVYTNLENTFIREEKEGALCIIPNGGSINECMILNSTAKKILFKIHENKISLYSLIKYFIREFDENPDRIYLDILTYVKKLYMLGFIQSKEIKMLYTGHTISEIGNMEVYKCAESDFKILNKILNIDVSEKTIWNVYAESGPYDKSPYNPINLRAKLFNYSEEFYILRNKYNNLMLLSVINGKYTLSRVSLIGTIKLFEKLSRDDIKFFVDTAISDHIKNDNTNVNKVRLSIASEQFNKNENMKNTLESIGFIQVACIKDEYGKGNDLILYDYYIK